MHPDPRGTPGTHGPHLAREVAGPAAQVAVVVVAHGVQRIAQGHVHVHGSGRILLIAGKGGQDVIEQRFHVLALLRP